MIVHKMFQSEIPMTLSRFRSALVVATTALAAAGAQAEVFVFGGLLSGTGPAAPSFATLSVTQNGADLDFVLSAPGLDLFGAASFLGALAVDGVKMGAVSNVSGGTVVALASGGGPTGVFDFRFDLTGPKQARLLDGESVSWTWSGAHQSVAGLSFAAHVQSVQIGGASDSLWYSATAVPEPEAGVMALAGLAVAGYVGRRRKRG